MSCVLTAERKSFDVIKKYITFTLKILQGEKETCMEDYHLPPDNYQDDEKHNFAAEHGETKQEKHPAEHCPTTMYHRLSPQLN